ncbi:MAG: T9SS type A sorting domain-containing protein, partial [Bacteroidota bacterium]|nr:T9SS type A sorting domain-containing protein [Bacteroidota bacterium]MDX5431937.1 T9SS type A sorting domain-containing protein [Bacteroidota bacterium]MDX5470655.1 T9SS type A sorting domain-containing protein [Bacteroidota bacterium]
LADTTGGSIYNLSLDVPAIDDIDGDGDLDILAFGVLGGYVQYYRNERIEKNLDCDALNFNFIDFCWGSFVEAGFTNEIILGDNCWGWKYYKNAVHQGSTILTFDGDEDGDMEMLIGDVDYPDFKYLINGRKENNWPWDTITGFTTHYPQNNAKGVYIDKFPAAFYLDINNDGIKDLIASSNEANAASNLGQIWWYQNKGKNNNPNFEFRDSSLLQDQTIDFGSQTYPSLFDFDGDGDLDLIVSNRGNFRDTKNTNDRLALFENVGTSSKAIFKFKEGNYLNLSDDSLNGVYPCFADLTDDGLPDLLIGQLNGRIRYYVNTGSASQPSFSLQNDQLGGIDVGVSAAPHCYDLDDDGLLDLIIGSSNGMLKYFRNTGTKSSPVFASTPTLDSMGRVQVSDFYYNYTNFGPNGEPIDSVKTFEYEGHSTPWVVDMDNDGKDELVVGSKSGKLFIFNLDKNNLTDSFSHWEEYFHQPFTKKGDIADLGGRISPAIFDASGDGFPDVILGNGRGGLLYLSSERVAEDTMTSLSPIAPSLSVVMYPNPSNGSIKLRQSTALGLNLEVEIRDVLGRLVYQGTWDTQAESVKFISLNELKNGSYYVVLQHPEYRKQSLPLTLVR